MAKIPEGFNTITPSLVLNGAAKAIDLYKKAFGAQELYRMEVPGTGKLMHACLVIGNSKIFLSDTDPKMSATPSTSSFYLYMDDVDAAFTQAKKAGLNELVPVQDMFWGDRMGAVEDSFGIRWTLATHVREVSQEEMEAARKNWGKAA
jgi:PhnB protein